jgi:uncharacterized membrane protein
MQILFILLTGLVLRLISINQSLWLDEATTALVSRMPVGDIFTRFLPGDFHPPLYYLILKGWVMLFGSTEIALRIPSVIFGILTVYVIYKIAGKIPAILLATSGLHIYYSQEARMYSLATFLVAWLIYTFIKKRWRLFSILLVAVGMTDYVSLFILPVFWLAGWKDKKKLLFSHVPLVLVFALWLPTFIGQLGIGVGTKLTAWWQILGTASIKNILLIPVKFMIGRISFEDKNLYMIVACILSLLFGYLLFKARKGSKLFFLWLVVPIVIGVIVSLKIPTLSYFRFLFVLPAFYILLGKGIENSGKYNLVLLSLVVGVNLITSGFYLFNSKFQREDWRSASSTIGEQRIVFPAPTQTEALNYYGKGSQIINASQINVNDKVLWLSRYVWEIFDENDSARQRVEGLGYNKTSEYNFNGVILWKYEK